MEYLLHLGTLVCVWGILAMSLNLIVGYTGLLSLTHAAFYGVGAYATGFLMRTYDLDFFLTVIIGAAIAGALAFLVGFVFSKFRGDYYALVTLGFATIMYAVFLNFEAITRGPLGLPGIPRPEFFSVTLSQTEQYFVLTLVAVLATYGIVRYITRSSFGRVLKAIREDEKAIEVFGYRTLFYKQAVFVIGAMLAALAGSVMASYFRFIDPSVFVLFESIYILSIVILGGLATHRGAILGAVLLTLLPEALRFVGFPNEIAGQMRQVVYGVILVLLMLYRPQGLIGEYKL